MNMSDILRAPRIYTRHWAKNRSSIRVTDLGTCYLDYLEEVAAYNYANRENKKVLRPFTKILLEFAFDEYLRELPDKVRSELASNIKCTKENLEPLKLWVKAVTGKVEEDDLNIIAHWLWLVKRNSQKLPVVHHIMPIITSSKQGGGKSTAVVRLTEPLKKVMLELKIPQAVDERSFTLFENYLIGFFDEMAGAEKVEISDFKRNVTSGTITYRPMRTNLMQTITNLCTFIGASNNQVYEIIKDTTGIRRFFPIQALDLLDHETINTLDYLELWRGIDERLPRGYYENVKDTVAKKQDDMAMKDEVLLFLEDHNVVPSPSDKHETVNGKYLYNAYIIHARNSGLRFNVSAQTFYKKLRDLGIQGAKKLDEKRNRAWFFAINSEHGLDIGKELPLREI